MTGRIDVSIVIPVYNSSECLPELVGQLSEVFGKLERPYEVILVDDASPDTSWDVIRSLCRNCDNITGLRLMNNSGQHRATICGLRKAGGSIVVTMDDDLQHRPDQLPLLLDALDKDPKLDCVFGLYREKKHAGYRNVGSHLIRAVNARAFGLPRGIRSSSFRAMRAHLARAICAHTTANPVIPALVFSTTRHVANVTVEHSPRYAGRSGYSFTKQLRLALDNICNVSLLPLRAVTMMGFTFCGLALVFVLSVLYRYFTNRITVPGWATLSIAVTFSSGIILLSLGVIGEYMVRILREVRGAPEYVIRESVGPGAEPNSTGSSQS